MIIYLSGWSHVGRKERKVRYKISIKKIRRVWGFAKRQNVDQKCEKIEQVESQRPKECHRTIAELTCKKTTRSSYGFLEKMVRLLTERMS